MNGRLLRVLVPAILFLALPLLLSQDARAASFTATSSPSTINASATNFNVTITITDVDASLNITKVNLTLNAFVFVNGTASTTATDNSFGNTSTNLIWTNSSPAGFITSGSGVQSFTFNVNAPLTAGTYAITVAVTDTSGLQNSTNVTYSVIDLPNYPIIFSSLSQANTTQSTNWIKNLSYTIGITNNGNLIEQYNLSVVDCSNASQQGVGILNFSSITVNPSETKAVLLNVSNSTAGLYSSCIMARHYNGTADSSYVTSAQNNVILNSGFYPDLTVPVVSWIVGGGPNPFIGSSVNVTATLNNSGQFNFTGNVSVNLLWDGNIKNTMTIANTSLANGIPYNATFSNFTIDSSGLHSLSVSIDPSNSVTESNESNNVYTTQIFVGYNVTVLSVTGQSSWNVTTNRNVTVSVWVRYANGSNVTTLDRANFSAYDMQGGSILGTFDYSNSVFNDSFSKSAATYTFNIVSYGGTVDTTPGVHNITIYASNNESGAVYSGNSTGNDYYYLVVPKLSVIVNAPDDVDEGSSKSVTINVTNTGTDAVYNVTLSVSSSDTSVLTLGSLTSCKKNGGSTTLGNNFLNYSDYITCNIVATGQDVSEDEYPEIDATAYGNYSYLGSTVIQYTGTGADTILVNLLASTESPGGGGGSSARRCTSNASCLDNESCSASKTCVAISCPGGTILDHVCTGASSSAGDRINITAFDRTFEALSGGSVSTKVTVKNIGTTAYVAKLGVSISGITADISPSGGYSLGSGESYQFTVNFTVPNTTEVGNFTGTFKAYVSSNTSASDSETFTFSVFPSEEAKTEIAASYQNISSQLASLAASLSVMKADGRYNQTVISSLEELVRVANATLSEAKDALDSDDYISANSLISRVNTSISAAETQMQSAQTTVAASMPAYGIWFWVAIGVIIIFVVGFFIYMFYPSKLSGYRPDKGFAPRGARGGGIMAKLTGVFKREKKQKPAAAFPLSTVAAPKEEPKEAPKEEQHYDTFRYSEGYKKEKSYDYQYPKGAGGGGLLGRFKKEKEVSPQMHIDQFSAQTEEEKKKKQEAN